MISGGAKEVLMAWQLSWRGRAASSAQDPHSQLHGQALALEHRWLSTRPPPKGGLRPRSNAPGCNSKGSEHRLEPLTPILSYFPTSSEGRDLDNIARRLGVLF